MKKPIFILILILFSLIETGAQPWVKGDSLLPVETIAWTNIVFGKNPDTINKPNVVVVSCRRLDSRWIDNFFASKKLEKHHKMWYMVASYQLPVCYLDTVATLSDALNKLNFDNDFLFYIHGHGKDFNQSLEVAKRLSERYNINVVVFDWPSRNGNLSRSMKLIRHSSKDLFSVLTDFNNFRKSYLSPGIKITTLMHSLGNYYLIRLIKDKRADLLGGDNPVFDRIILNSAAIKSKNHAHCLDMIGKPADIVITQNENDFVLHGAQFITFSGLLGIRTGEKYFPAATYLNFSQIAEKQHTYFLVT